MAAGQRTIFFRVTDPRCCAELISTLKEAAHFRNMLLILVRMARHECQDLARLLLSPDILRALIFDRQGGKKASNVKKCRHLCRTRNQDFRDLYEEFIRLGKTFDAKHIYKISKALAGEFKGYQSKKAKGENAGEPRARKLRDISNIALPLDAERVYIKDGFLAITIGGHRHFEIPFHNIVIDKLISLEKIASYRLCFDGRDVTVNITYEKITEAHSSKRPEKIAAIDLGVNQTCSVLILDEDTPSMVLSGKVFKSYNHDFNRKKAKAASRKDLLHNRMLEIEEDVKEALDFDEDLSSDLEKIEDLMEWQELKKQHGHWKSLIDSLYARRKRFFHTNFHKIARSLLHNLEASGVTTLVLSRDILQAKNKTHMGKVGNQKFVFIPFAILIDALMLYGVEHGIEVIDDVNESYSSKTNALYGDVLKAQKLASSDKGNSHIRRLRAKVFQGRRHKNSFTCGVTKKIWHADLNGALNILAIYLGSLKRIHLLREASFKLESPKVLAGKALFEWLDRKKQVAA